MSISFDGQNKVITLTAGTTYISVRDLWSRAVDWWLTLDNSKYIFPLTQVGGNDIDASSGTKIPIYCFLMSGWRIRPQESNHTLNVGDGIILVDGGGDPFINPIGQFVVRINYQQPVQAISFATEGGGTATIDYQQVTDAVWNAPAANYNSSGTIGKTINTNNDLLNEINISIGDMQLINQKILGLMHHNMSIDNTTYDQFGNLINARVRIYADKGDVGSDNGIIGEYRMICVATESGKFQLWKQIEA